MARPVPKRESAPVPEVYGELERLRKRNVELEDFIENGSIGLHWVGADGTILWANRTELELLGYDEREYVGHHIAEFHADEEVIADILRRLGARETLRNYEARLRAKDGSIRHVAINSNVLWDGERFVHTRCFTRDITGILQAREEIDAAYAEVKRIADEGRAREEAVRLALQKSAVVVFHQDAELRYRWVYNPFAEHEGVPLTDKLDTDLFPADEAAQLNGLKRGVLATCTGARAEIALTTQGQAQIMDIRIEPFRDGTGAMAGVVGVAVDVTERKRNEEKLRGSLENLRTLAARLQMRQETEWAGASREVHDLGQVLTALECEFAVMAERLATCGGCDLIGLRLKEVSALLSSMIESSARISGQLGPPLLNDLGLAPTLLSHALAFAGRAGIRVVPGRLDEFQVNRQVGVAVFRIFQEILANIERHSGASEVHISLRREPGGAAMRIGDNGAGISPESIADPASEGLLSIRELASLFGGEIEVEGVRGMGTAVMLRIPEGARMTGREG